MDSRRRLEQVLSLSPDILYQKALYSLNVVLLLGLSSDSSNLPSRGLIMADYHFQPYCCLKASSIIRTDGIEWKYSSMNATKGEKVENK